MNGTHLEGETIYDWENKRFEFEIDGTEVGKDDMEKKRELLDWNFRSFPPQFNRNFDRQILRGVGEVMYYIIKFQDGSYVKTGRYDTFKIDDAKKV